MSLHLTKVTKTSSLISDSQTQNGPQQFISAYKYFTVSGLLKTYLVLMSECLGKSSTTLHKIVKVFFLFREEAQAKLQALKERDRADLVLHSQEMRELQRRFDLDSKLQDFLGVKGQKRIMADLEAKEAIKKQQQKEATEQLITAYNSILDQIKQFSGESDVDRLAARFLKQEEENFTLFNYVNELNNEVSKVIKI